MSSLDKLINLFARFPSLGPKSARRIVLYLLKNKETLIFNKNAKIDNFGRDPGDGSDVVGAEFS